MPTPETPNDPSSHEELYAEMVRESSGLREEILTMEGGLLPLAEFARRVNRNPDSVQAALDARQLIGFEPEKGGEPPTCMAGASGAASSPAWKIWSQCG